MKTNIRGTENVVEAAVRHGARILFASTSEVYGKNTKIGLGEDDDRITGSPLKSRWSYAEAKAIDESLVSAYVKERGLQAVIVRLFNTVGPRQTGHYGMVVPRFVQQALAGEPLTVFGSGAQVRCFCHVADVVPALAALLRNPSANSRAVNLSSAVQVSIELWPIGDPPRRVGLGHPERVFPGGLRPRYGDMQRRVRTARWRATWLASALTIVWTTLSSQSVTTTRRKHEHRHPDTAYLGGDYRPGVCRPADGAGPS